MIVFDEDPDYTQFIMKTVNAAIQITQNIEDDSRERTMKEVYNQFSEQLFWIAQHKKYQPII